MAARLCGVNVRHVYALTFAVSAAFAGAAGIVIGIILPFSPADEATWTLNAFVVVVLGGVGSPAGALIGGLLLGMVSTLTAQYIGPSFPNVTMFLLLVLLLLVRPTGPAGQRLRALAMNAASPVLAVAAHGGRQPSLLALRCRWCCRRSMSGSASSCSIPRGSAVAWTILGGFAGYASFGHAAFIGVGAFAAGLVEERVLRPAAAVAAAARPRRRRAVLRRPVGGDRLSDPAPARHLLRHRHAGRQPRLRRAQQQRRLLRGLARPQLPADRAQAAWIRRPSSTALPRGRRIVFLLIAWQIQRSRFGAGLLSIREDEDTARMLGVPTERYKRIAFVVSAVLTGLLGVIYAHSLGYITTNSVYRDDTNLSLIVYSLLGGMGTLFGPVIGAFMLVFITQVMLGRLLDFHLFATGLLLVVLVLAAPGGVLGFVQSWR